MAIVRAVKTGVWSDPTVWNTGALPTAADDVYSNTFTVTIDTSPTVLSIRNGSATGVSAGGGFVLSNETTVSAQNGFIYGAGNNATLLASSLLSGQSCNIVGSVSYTSTPNPGSALSHSGLGTINLTGNVSGCVGGNAAIAVSNSGLGVINVTGSVTGGNSSSTAVLNPAGGTINITGQITGGQASNPASGVGNSGVGLVNITGNCHGGIGANATNYAVFLSSNGTLVINGSCTASANAPAISVTTLTGVAILSGPFITSSNGINPLYAARWFWANSNVSPTYYQVRTANLSIVRSLYTADSVGGNPATNNVRSGTVYGPNSELTGTCAVPPAASVGVGVPVDNTTGTAAITAASIRSAMGLAAADLDTQLAALPTAAEVRIEMDSNSTKLANLDATVSSRLASSGYTAPPSAADVASAVWGATVRTITNTIPTAADIATAVWAAATRTLTTAIDNSATIAAAVWSYATGRTITGGTVDTLTNAPSVPSADTIASRVWATADKAGYSLTEAERTAIATAVQAGILNESDGQAILNAIVGAIGNTNVDQVALVAAIRADLERTGGTLATRLAAADYDAPLDAAGIRTAVGLASANLDTQLDALPIASEIATAVWAAADKVGYSLTEAERTAIATAVQAGILNESDGQQILNAIVNAIGNQNIDQVALVAAIRADLERTGGTLQTRLASSAYTTPPTASANAVAVWGAASRTITGGIVDNLVNAPDVPTPEEIADQARIEFAAELSRAVNTATTQEVADIVEGAMRSPNP